MQKILIIGCSGSGKSTLARALGRRLGLSTFHLDRVYWRAGWQPSSDQEFDERLARIIALPRWIIDGNFSRTLELRLGHADTVIHLDFARWRCLWGAAKRCFLCCNFESRPRPDMADGCPERWDWEFIEWIWNFRAIHHEQTLRMLELHAERLSVITLRTPREIDAFLKTVQPG